MKYLLNTHILLWALSDDANLPDDARAIISLPENEKYFSVASVWEIAIKHMKAPEYMPVSGDLIVHYCDLYGILLLPIRQEHVLMLPTLRRSADAPPHNDPFDRILIAQAKLEGMIFLTHDRLLKDYNESCVRTL